MNVIHSIILQNFRNYSFRQFEFPHKINFFVGNNGSGKTNLLEAISMLSSSSGLRGAELKELNQNFTKPFAIGFETNIGSIGIKNINGVKRSFLGEEGAKFSALQNKFNILSVTSEDEFIFRASVSERRKFFDSIIAKISKDHSEHLKDYRNLCTQRSKLLGQSSYSASWIEIIEKQIAQKLVNIAINRILICEKLSSCMMLLSNFELRGKIIITGYLENKIQKGNFIASKEEECLREKLIASRDIDSITGKTLTKLERTNFDILLQEKNFLSTLSSSGEQKKMLFSLFLSLIKITHAPIILIDEVISKFDNFNRDIIFNEFKEIKSQFFLTGTEKLTDINCNFIDI